MELISPKNNSADTNLITSLSHPRLSEMGTIKDESAGEEMINDESEIDFDFMWSNKDNGT